MNRHDSDRAKGAAVGMAIGAAMGAVGSYMVQQHPREVKKMVKQATQTAEKAMQNLDHMLSSR